MAKIKDLSENLLPFLSRAAKTSPKFWSMGGGAAARSAHSWIRHCYSSAILYAQHVLSGRRIGNIPCDASFLTLACVLAYRFWRRRRITKKTTTMTIKVSGTMRAGTATAAASVPTFIFAASAAASVKHSHQRTDDYQSSSLQENSLIRITGWIIWQNKIPWVFQVFQTL